MATAPASETKTKRDYFWLLPASFERLTKRILSIAETGFSSYKELTRCMKRFYKDQVISKAGVLMRHSSKHSYDMRSIRAYHATNRRMYAATSCDSE
mmetsp:Transcript_17359/g.23412  ORF Transcript_17359/g.23412 Transcript_17359/m.23412 type:complete len:97 (+) Transcript_17359:980-1270(+)